MNGICHIEIPSKDFEKAKKFYGELFVWKFQEMEGMDYMLFNPSDGIGGGFSKGADFVEKPGTLIYVEIESIEDTIAKAEGLGGTTVMGKTQISPEHGYIAVLTDLEGNQIGLWTK